MREPTARKKVLRQPLGDSLMRSHQWLLALFVATPALSLLACAAPPSPVDPEAAITPPRFIVFGIDRSGSYDFVKVGLDAAARTIAKAEPGDTVIVRWISDTSFLNQELATRIELPNMTLADCSSNVFDSRCRRERSAQDAELDRLKRAHMTRLLALKPPSAGHTDIFGFLQAASDAFSEVPAEAERLLYLATDLKDNVGYEVVPNLAGVRVRVFALQTEADPEGTLRLRKRWAERFTGYGADDITFTTSEAGQ